MSRYVDADGIIKRLNDMTVEGETFITAVNFAKLIVENAPTAYIVPKEKYDKLLEKVIKFISDRINYWDAPCSSDETVRNELASVMWEIARQMKEVEE